MRIVGTFSSVFQADFIIHCVRPFAYAKYFWIYLKNKAFNRKFYKTRSVLRNICHIFYVNSFIGKHLFQPPTPSILLKIGRQNTLHANLLPLKFVENIFIFVGVKPEKGLKFWPFSKILNTKSSFLTIFFGNNSMHPFHPILIPNTSYVEEKNILTGLVL